MIEAAYVNNPPQMYKPVKRFIDILIASIALVILSPILLPVILILSITGEKEVFLISLKAGGTGLNLTGADTVILYDLWWNPAVEEQAAGRAHRMGQKKVVEVWRMIAEGTIEERMEALQHEKRELFQKVIQGNETQLQQLTEEDIRLILSIGEE